MGKSIGTLESNNLQYLSTDITILAISNFILLQDAEIENLTTYKMADKVSSKTLQN